MGKHFHLHLSHYFFLLSILFAGLVSFIYFSAFPVKQFGVVIITAALYVLWGIAHHYAEGDLYPKIMVEYIVIALLSILLLRGVIYR